MFQPFSSLCATRRFVGCGLLLISVSALLPHAKAPTAAHSPLGSVELQELISSTQRARTVLGWAGCQWNLVCGLGECGLSTTSSSVWACRTWWGLPAHFQLGSGTPLSAVAGAAPWHCPFPNVSVPSSTSIDYLLCEIKHLKSCKLLLQYGKWRSHFYLARAGSWEQQKAISVSGIWAQHQSLVSREPFLPKESSLIKDRGKDHKLQLLAEPMFPQAVPLHRAAQT